MTSIGRRIGNNLYWIAFPIYRPLYSFFKSYTDRAERRLLRANLGEGSVVVDAGANIGIYSQFLAQRVGKTGFVHSFEPSPENFAHLSDAVSAFGNVRVHQCAVGAQSEKQILYISNDLNVDHRLYPVEGESRRTMSIDVIALDDYFAPGARVDLIKLDIQGYESQALQGASRVLAENYDIKLLLEVWPYGLRQAGSSVGALLELLRDNDFILSQPGSNRTSDKSSHKEAEKDFNIYYNLFAHRKTISHS